MRAIENFCAAPVASIPGQVPNDRPDNRKMSIDNQTTVIDDGFNW
jgi:hypothetical protein